MYNKIIRLREMRDKGFADMQAHISGEHFMGRVAGFVLLPLLAGAVFLLIRLVQREIWKRHLDVRILFKKSAIYVGEDADLVIQAKDEKKLPVRELTYSVRLPDGLKSPDGSPRRITGNVKSGGRAAKDGKLKMRRVYHISGVRRGRYEVRDIAFRAVPFARLFFARKHSENENLICVYASRTDVEAVASLIEEAARETENRKRLAYPAPASPYASIQPDQSSGANHAGTLPADGRPAFLQAGSDLDRLFRGQGILTRMYSSVHDYQVQIFLDVESFDYKNEYRIIEDSISVAASLASELMMKAIPTGLLINAVTGAGQENLIFTPGTGDEKLRQIELALTMDFSDVLVSDFVSLTMHLSENQLPVFISKNADQARADDMAENLPPGFGGVLVIPCTANTQKKVHGTGNLKVMYRELPE